MGFGSFKPFYSCKRVNGASFRCAREFPTERIENKAVQPEGNEMAEQSIQKPAQQIVLEIAKQALDDAKEITVLVGLIREQNTGGVNKRLSEAGASNVVSAVRNASIARLVIVVARAYAKPRHGDRHVQ